MNKVKEPLMYKLFLLALLSFSLFAVEENPTKIEYVNEMSFLLGNSENGSDTNLNRSLAYQLQFQYNDLDFPIKPEIAYIHSQNIDIYTTGERTKYSAMMVNGIYEIDYTDTLTPFVKAGLGYASYSDEPGTPKSSAFFDFGFGGKLNITDRWALKFEALAGVASSHINILATAGISFKFGRKYIPRSTQAECQPLTPAPAPAKVCEPCSKTPIIVTKIVKEPIPTTKTFSPQSIKFEFGMAKLTDESKAAMVSIAKALNRVPNKDKEILIIGNTDSKGSRAFNATLSIKRANAVRTAFIANGIDPHRISIDGLGEINPIADNSTEAGREKNRRVIIILKEPLEGP